MTKIPDVFQASLVRTTFPSERRHLLSDPEAAWDHVYVTVDQAQDELEDLLHAYIDGRRNDFFVLRLRIGDLLHDLRLLSIALGSASREATEVPMDILRLLAGPPGPDSETEE